MRLLNRLTFTFTFTCIWVCWIVAEGEQLSGLSNPLIDSLKQKISTVSGNQKVDLLNKIAYNYYYFKNDSTRKYATRAIELSAELGYLKGQAEAERLMGISYKAQNQEKEAISWLHKGLATAESINDHQSIADNLNSIGIFYKSVEDNKQALRYFRRSLHHQILAGNKLRQGLLFANIGGLYKTIKQYDSAGYYYERSRYLLDSIGDKKWIAMVYSQYSGLLIEENKLDTAQALTQRAFELSKQTGQIFHLRKCYQNFAEIYLKERKFNRSMDMANQAISLSQEIGFVPFLLSAYKIKFQIYAAQKQYKKALEIHEIYSTYKDSLHAAQIRSEADLYEFQNALEKKEKENLILKKENENSRARNLANKIKIQRQTILVVAILVILTLVSVLALVFFRLRQKEREININLKKSNYDLAEQKEELAATLQMVQHLNAQLQAQNNTINKIAIVSITDLVGNIISVNDNFCNTSGYSREELLGNHHRIIKSGEHDKKFYQTLWKTITKGNTWRGEIKNKRKNGKNYWADTAIAPIFDEEGQPKQFFSLQFEITDRKNYLQQIAEKGVELEKMNRLKDKLLSVVSHDFRSPLNSLRGTLNLFLQGAISNEELKMLSKDLVNKLDNTYNLLENLLNWAKSQMQGMQVYKNEIDLAELTRDTVKLLRPMAENKMVTLNNDILEAMPVYADNEMIKLVLRNLIANAIKFTSAGNSIFLHADNDGRFVKVSVKDNGLGISNENQSKLFKLESFTTSGTSNEIGMGLGLNLCKDFIEKNGGNIWFESELGQGSTFYFTIPQKG